MEKQLESGQSFLGRCRMTSDDRRRLAEKEKVLMQEIKEQTFQLQEHTSTLEERAFMERQALNRLEDVF